MNKKKMFVTYSEKLILEKVDLGGCYRSIFHNKKSVWAHGLTMKYRCKCLFSYFPFGPGTLCFLDSSSDMHLLITFEMGDICGAGDGMAIELPSGGLWLHPLQLSG